MTLLIVATPPQYGYAVDIGYECSPEYKSSIFHTRLSEVELTGDMRVDIVNIAKSQIGYHEGDGETKYDGMSTDADEDYNEYGYWYYNNVTKSFDELHNAPWCAMFVSWCARQAGISTDIIANSINAVPYNGDENKVGRHFNVEEKTASSGYVPLPGDLIMFDWTKTGKIWSHVGIVCDVVDNAVEGIRGKTIITIEGNSSNKVAVRAYSADDVVIRAYGVPDYVTSDHVHTWKTEKQTSCTESGSKICTTCGQTETIEKLDHQYWNWGDVVTDEDKLKFRHTDIEATCTTAGESSFHCIRCGYRDMIEKIDAKGHDYRVVKRIEPTCTQTGVVYYVCNNNNTHVHNEELKIISHNESDWIVDKAPTYNESGKRHKECTLCKQIMREEVIPKLKDELYPNCNVTVNGAANGKFDNKLTVDFFTNKAVNFVIEANDGESGIKNIAYFLSDKVLTMEQVKDISGWTHGDSGTLSKDGKYIIYVKVSDNVGNITYINSVMFVVDTVLPKISGAENNKAYCGDVKFTVNEDCTVKVDSDTVYKSTQNYYVIKKSGVHNISVTDNAGNTASITVTKYNGHDSGRWETVKNVTCTEDGVRQRICTRCNGVIERLIDKSQGHIAGQWSTQKEATCTRDGKEIKYCLTCGETLEEHVIAAEGHILSDWVVLTEATCIKNGKAVKYCKICNENIREQIIQSVGHEEGDWKSETEPTCTHEGHNVRRCLNCDEVLEEETVDALGHRISYGKCIVCGYIAPVRWVILSIAVASMLAYTFVTMVRDMRQKRRKQ